MKLLQIDEVAGILDVTIPRAYVLARSGVIPIVRIGRQVRVSADALREWIEAGGTGSADRPEDHEAVEGDRESEP